MASARSASRAGAVRRSPSVRLSPRAQERARAVALTHHYRDHQRLTIAEIAERLGRSPATVRGYLYDADGSKGRRLKDSYRGICAGCGAPTSGGDGPGRARVLCVSCSGKARRKWSTELLYAALRAWFDRYGFSARSTDLSRSYAARCAARGDVGRLRRLEEGWQGGPWPALSVVQYHCGALPQANTAALASRGDCERGQTSPTVAP